MQRSNCFRTVYQKKLEVGKQTTAASTQNGVGRKVRAVVNLNFSRATKSELIFSVTVHGRHKYNKI